MWFADESGFSPTQPTGYTWSSRGRRTRVPYENPKRRRVNAFVAVAPYGPRPTLRYRLFARTLTGADVVACLRRLARPGVRGVVVLDNAGIHISRIVQRARPALRGAGIELFYLPGYAPELNEVEPFFGVLKLHEMPERTYTTVPALMDAIRRGLRTLRRRLRRK